MSATITKQFVFYYIYCKLVASQLNFIYYVLK